MKMEQHGAACMGKKWRILLGAFLVTALAVVAWQTLFRPQPSEPRNQGKRLSKRLEEFGTEPRKRGTAELALKEIGTNAMPYLIAGLKATESPAMSRLLGWVRSQSLIKIHWQAPSDRAQAAILGFQSLGPKAAPAIPDLISLFHNSSPYYGSHDPVYQAARALRTRR